MLLKNAPTDAHTTGVQFRRLSLPNLSTLRTVAGFLLFFSILATHAASDTTLSPQQQHLRDSLLNIYTIDYCCGTTLRNCLDKQDSCSITPRLVTFLSWLVGTVPDPDPAKVRTQLDLRYNGFIADTQVSIDTAHLQITGKPDAPVTVIVYVSAYCPSCKKHVATLRNTILADKYLKENVALYAKPVGRGIANIALLAATEDGTFWKLFYALRRVYSIFKDTSDIIPVAAKAGVLSEQFLQHLSDTTVQQRLRKNIEESRRNGVQHFPAYFINYRPYLSYKDTRWVTDAIFFELERLNSH